MQANSALLPKLAGLAGTGLPGPLKAMKKKFFGVFFIVPHMKRYQTAHKVELVSLGGICHYNWQNVVRALLEQFPSKMRGC